MDALESGQIDLGFTRPLPKAKASRFVQERVYRDRVVAVLPQRHALAGSPKVSLEELADEEWVLLNRSTSPEMVDGFTLLCASAGFAPRVINEAARIQTVFALVAAGMGVSLSPSYIRRFNPPGVTFIPLQPNPPPIDLVAARPRGEPPPTVAAFIDMLRQQLPRIRRQYAYRHRRTGAPKGRKDSAQGFNPGLIVQRTSALKVAPENVSTGFRVSTPLKNTDLVPLSGHIP